MHTFATYLLVGGTCFLLGLFSFMILRYLLNYRLGVRNAASVRVQRSQRQAPPPKEEGLFLPGSHAQQEDSVSSLIEELEKGRNLQKSQRKMRKSLLGFSTKEDLKRAYLLDSLLDKPKWKEREEQ
ncbi:MAG: hypothetical protein AAFR61_00485 [Bacteroidota bacterium]